MELIYTLSCLECQRDLPQAFKERETLNTTKIKCSFDDCEYEDLANQFTIQEQTTEEWFGSQYNEANPGTISGEEFKEIYKKESQSNKMPLGGFSPNPEFISSLGLEQKKTFDYVKCCGCKKIIKIKHQTEANLKTGCFDCQSKRFEFKEPFEAQEFEVQSFIYIMEVCPDCNLLKIIEWINWREFIVKNIFPSARVNLNSDQQETFISAFEENIPGVIKETNQKTGFACKC